MILKLGYGGAWKVKKEMEEEEILLKGEDPFRRIGSSLTNEAKPSSGFVFLTTIHVLSKAIHKTYQPFKLD